MPRRPTLETALLLGQLLAAPVAWSADCSVNSGLTQAHVVELYTSEGCSSCPPADRWLSALDTGPGLIALSFHVDYWDYLGWRDPFASASFSRRQQQLAQRGGSGVVYTPEVALDGREYRGWSRGLPAAQKHSAAVNLALSVHPEPGRLLLSTELRGGASAVPTAAKVWFALTQSGLETRVAAGENRGKLLRHDHVVRTLSGPHSANAAGVELLLPADFDPGQAHVVAWADDAHERRYLQAVSLPLAACLPP